MPATSRKPLHQLLTERKVMAGGYERSYLIHVPSTAGPSPSSLVMMLHGAGDTARGAVCQTRWHEKADKEGFVVVFPEALRPLPAEPAGFDRNSQIWNDGSRKGFAYEHGVDDCAFLSSLAGQITAELGIPAGRALVTGFSNGGGMAFRLGNAAPDIFSAVAPVCGHFWADPLPMNSPSSLYYLVGGADPINPLAGGSVTLPWGTVVKPPTADSLKKWLSACGCSASPAETRSSGGVDTDFYGTGGSGKPCARYVRMSGAGHVWPGGRNSLPADMAGSDSSLIDATGTIWGFFSALQTDIQERKGAMK